MKTETQFRQNELNKHFNKYNNNKYDYYIFADCSRVIVFLKYLKTKKRFKSKTINIDGLFIPIDNLQTNI